MKVKVCRNPARYEIYDSSGWLMFSIPGAYAKRAAVFGIPTDLKDGEVREMEWTTPIGPVRTCENCGRHIPVECVGCNYLDNWKPKKTEA